MIGGRVGEDLENGQRAHVDQHAERLAQQEVADEHARLVAPDHARGLLAAPEAALVDDVVVQQRRRVHELDGRRHADVAAAGIVAQLGGRQRQHGAQPLAARIDEVMGELEDHLDFGDRLVENDAVDRLHVLGNEVEERFEAFRRASRAFEWYDEAQGRFPGAGVLTMV